MVAETAAGSEQALSPQKKLDRRFGFLPPRGGGGPKGRRRTSLHTTPPSASRSLSSGRASRGPGGSAPPPCWGRAIAYGHISGIKPRTKWNRAANKCFQILDLFRICDSPACWGRKSVRFAHVFVASVGGGFTSVRTHFASSGMPGSFLLARMTSAVFTLATFFAAVSVSVMNN